MHLIQQLLFILNISVLQVTFNKTNEMRLVELIFMQSRVKRPQRFDTIKCPECKTTNITELLLPRNKKIAPISLKTY